MDNLQINKLQFSSMSIHCQFIEMFIQTNTNSALLAANPIDYYRGNLRSILIVLCRIDSAPDFSSIRWRFGGGDRFARHSFRLFDFDEGFANLRCLFESFDRGFGAGMGLRRGWCCFWLDLNLSARMLKAIKQIEDSLYVFICDGDRIPCPETSGCHGRMRVRRTWRREVDNGRGKTICHYVSCVVTKLMEKLGHLEL